jgi:hypothetical protein
MNEEFKNGVVSSARRIFWRGGAARDSATHPPTQKKMITPESWALAGV